MSSDNGIYIGKFPKEITIEHGCNECGEPATFFETNYDAGGEDSFWCAKHERGNPILFEYRVIHAQAIENCDWRFDDEPPYGKAHEVNPESEWKPETKLLQDCQRLVYFGESQSFPDEASASKEASRLDEEIDFTEYGICFLEFNRPLPNISLAEAQEKLDQYWERKQKERALQQEEREKNTKRYVLLVPVEVSEYNGELNGYISKNELKASKEAFGIFDSKENASQFVKASLRKFS